MKSINKRLRAFLVLAILIASFIVVRILHIQIFSDEYKAFAEEQRKSIEELNPDRGNIYDSQGNALAESLKVNSLYLYPSYVNDEERLGEFLGKFLNISENEIQDMLKSGEKTSLKSNLSGEEIDKINSANIRGLDIETQSTRYYPRQNYASHMIGFLDSEGHGEYGLEAYYDKVLYGEEGLNVQEKSALGDDIPYDKAQTKEAHRGSDIKLTIDPKIQDLVIGHGLETYEEYRPNKLSIVVMDPNNGDILAMENFPNFDPNNPKQAVRDSYKDENLSEDELIELCFENWRNYGVSDSYEPGSIFKFVTASAGYEEEAFDDSTIFECDGSFDEIEGVTLTCHIYPDGHGSQSLEEAMANSCNPSFIQMGRYLGEEKMFEYLGKFGFHEKTGIDLPAEAYSIIPRSVDEISEVRLATMSYGHGIALTPIQLISAISAIVNGGDLYQPKLVSEIKDPQTGQIREIEDKLIRPVISESTSARMRELMVYGVDNGTADGAQIPGYAIGGKTGTTEKFVEGEYSAESTVASFVGIYPSDKPEYVILAVADEPVGATSGNVVTAPLVTDIIRGIIEIRGDEPSRIYDVNNEEETVDWHIIEEDSLEENSVEAEEEMVNIHTEDHEPIEGNQDNYEIMVPDVTAYRLEDGIKILNNNGLYANIISEDYSDDSIIILHEPMGGDYVNEGSTIEIVAE